MVAHVLERLAPQVGDVLINANQNAERYARSAIRSCPTRSAASPGPLAGLHAGMTRARRAFVVTVPCDSPFLPRDLVARLAAALERERAQLAVANTFDQPHPVFALVAARRAAAISPRSSRRRTQDRRVVRDARRRRSRVRRRGRRVPQHQHAPTSSPRRANELTPVVAIGIAVSDEAARIADRHASRRSAR